MVETHRILVLNSLKFSEDKLMVNALSQTAGRVALVVRIAHSQRAAVRHTLFRPLALLEVEWDANPKLTVFKPRSARPVSQQLSLQAEPAKSTVVLFLAEFLLHATKIDPDGGLLFDYIAYALEWLDAARKDYANFHIVFLLRLSRFVGIRPNMEGNAALPYFDLQASEFVGSRPDHTYYVTGEEKRALTQLMRMDFATMHLFHLTGVQRHRILQYILLYYRLHLPGFPELKSLEVLGTVFR